jgi:hypothetical protein
LIAIIVDPTAPVYSFQSAPTTGEDAAGTPTAATTSMPRQRLRSIDHPINTDVALGTHNRLGAELKTSV